MKNKSKVYGGYGGVRNQYVYVPAITADFVPQPALVPFTEQDSENLETIANNIGFYAEHGANIMLRTSVSLGNSDVFTISTSANPADKIIYTADRAGINLNVMDGGFF